MRNVYAAMLSIVAIFFCNRAEAIDPNWASGPYNWTQGSSTIQMQPVSTHVCVLTRVSGDFDGGGESVMISQKNGWWLMGGTSMQSGIGGQAYCFVRNAFLANGAARWSSDDASVWASSSSGCFNFQHNGMWWGDATTLLNGIGGKLRTSGDRAQILQSNGAFTPSVMRIDTCQSGYLIAYGLSFFAGTPNSGVLAKYWNNTTYIASSGNGCVNSYGVHEVEMAPVNDAMCHFTSIGGGGNWDGGGEAVAIYPKFSGGIERWFLRAQSGYCGESRKTMAQAKCYRRDQR